MDPLRNAAYTSVGRACGFVGLAILVTMAGLSFDPVMATKTGALFTTFLAVFLIVRAQQAPNTPFRRSEVWLLLDEEDRPDDRYAQWAYSNVMRDTYLWFAHYMAAIAAVLWLVTVTLKLVLPDTGSLFD
ncbi:MAG: hypothetical protein AAGD23_05845 [Pseudomonadota bacterium]